MHYVLLRGLYAVPLLVAIIVVNFLLIHMSPGDPVSALIGPGIATTPEFIEQVRQSYGLDRPLGEQLLTYILRILKGDLGYSFFYRKPVIGVILDRLGPTMLLMGTALVLSSFLGVVLGVLAGLRPYSVVDNLVTAGGLIGYSVPVFWLGILLLLAFSVRIPLFPIGQMIDLRRELTGIAYVLDVAWHLVLPVVTLTLALMPLIMRMTRSSMLDVLRMEFVVTARAKGLEQRTVIFRHALKNAMLPVITVIGLNFGSLLAGAALVESVFSLPGVGYLLLETTRNRDTPVVLGVLLTVSVGVIVANLATDLLYGYLDPRVRYS